MWEGNKRTTLVVVGGGAAGFFSAITAKSLHPETHVVLLEKGSQLLAKVRLSGGGRCNVTHACFDPTRLVQNYPRGHRELLAPFFRFQPRDTITWFEERAVPLKKEEDGRVFPLSNTSQTIVDCLLNEAQKVGVEVRTQRQIESLKKVGSRFCMTFSSGGELEADALLLATGSSPQGYAWATSFGHSIQEPIPSLFTLNVPSSPFLDLSGVSLEEVELSLNEGRFSQRGALLITHWGFSGPAALKLSSWGARYLHDHGYRAEVSIRWLPKLSREVLCELLSESKRISPAQTLVRANPFSLPKNLWRRFLELTLLDPEGRMGELSKKGGYALLDRLHRDRYSVEGMTRHKEEFVTCGGVNLKEVNFQTMESRLCPGLFFAGEILDIDGVTGGFNFQSAWTTAWIAGQAMAG